MHSSLPRVWKNDGVEIIANDQGNLLLVFFSSAQSLTRLRRLFLVISLGLVCVIELLPTMSSSAQFLDQLKKMFFERALDWKPCAPSTVPQGRLFLLFAWSLGKVCSWTMHSVEIKHLISFRARVAIMRPLEFLLCKTSTVHALIRCQFVAKKNQKTKKRNIKKETHTGAKEKSIQESEDLKRSE